MKKIREWKNGSRFLLGFHTTQEMMCHLKVGSIKGKMCISNSRATGD